MKAYGRVNLDWLTWIIMCETRHENPGAFNVTEMHLNELCWGSSVLTILLERSANKENIGNDQAHPVWLGSVTHYHMVWRCFCSLLRCLRTFVVHDLLIWCVCRESCNSSVTPGRTTHDIFHIISFSSEEIYGNPDPVPRCEVSRKPVLAESHLAGRSWSFYFAYSSWTCLFLLTQILEIYF